MSTLFLAGIVAGIAAVATAAATPAVRHLAISAGVVRGVQADRWHTRATPAIGGIAIFLGFAVAVGVGYVLDPSAVGDLGARSPRAILPLSPGQGLALASTVAFVVGLVDDFRRLPPLRKLAGQLVAASTLLLCGIGVWLTGWYPLDAALSLFWFIGITNALNLLDNMDGLASGVAAIAAAYLAILFFLEGSPGLGVYALAFVAALVGFLVHNYPPARIFMGDSGSLFLGLSLAGLALAPAPGLSRSLATVLAAPVLILGVPILDTTLVTIGRFLEGRPISQGGKDHTSHRFVALGLSEVRTLWLLWSLAGAGGVAGLLLRSAERGTAILIGGVVVGGLTLVGAYLLTVRLRALESGTRGRLTLYRFLVDSQQRLPIFALMLDAIWIALAYYVAYLLRWDPAQLDAELVYFQRSVAVWVGVKALAFVLSGIYGSPFTTFGLFDGVRVVRTNLVATLLAGAALLALDRTGLSRGVVAIDFLACVLLTAGSRYSFRILEGTTRRWSTKGVPAVLLCDMAEAEAAARNLERSAEPHLRPVAVASPRGESRTGRIGSLTLYGGTDGLERALAATGAEAVVLVDRDRGATEALLGELARVDGVEAYAMEVVLRPLTAPVARR